MMENNSVEQKLKREVTVWRSARHTNVVALLGWMSEVVSEDGSSLSSSEGVPDKIPWAWSRHGVMEGISKITCVETQWRTAVP